MSNRRKLTLFVNERLISRAKDIGINISRITEKALEESIRLHENIRIHTYNQEINQRYEKPKNCPIFVKRSHYKRISVADPQGFEPWTPGFPHNL